MYFFELFVFLFLGLVLGSFATAIYYREEISQPWWSLDRKDKYYKSFCPQCDHQLHFKDLFPVFSFIIQRGKCRYCGAAIPKRYFFIELLSLLISLVFYAQLGFNAQALCFVFAIPFALPLLLLLVLKKKFSLRLVIISVTISLGASLLF